MSVQTVHQIGKSVEEYGEITSHTQILDGDRQKPYKWDVAWSNVLILSLLHLGAIYGFYLRWEAKLESHIFYKVLGVLMSLGITGGAHRLWSHRSYSANTTCQIVLAYMVTMTYQNSIYIWCRDHRLHHKFSETDADPHNAKRGFFFSHMGWLMLRKHAEVREKGKMVDMSDLEANAIVMFQHRYYYILVLLIAIVIPTFVPCYFWGESFKVAFFTVTIYRYIIAVHHTWCVNSLAHLYGKKPYDKNIGPTENRFTMSLVYGEGFHNYHHTFPWDYKAAELHYDTRNPTTFMIDFFAWLGWVTNRKVVPYSVIEKKIIRTGDGTYQKRPNDAYKILFMEIKKTTLINAGNMALMLFHLIVLI